jgi:hypothetical protein
MTTTATTNYGSTFTFNGSSIGACQVIDFPEISTGEIETTNHAGGGVAEYIPDGVLRLGEMTLSVIIAAGVVTTLDTAIDNKTVANAVVGNGIDTMTMSAFIKSVKVESADATSPDADKATVVVRPTGTITFS